MCLRSLAIPQTLNQKKIRSFTHKKKSAPRHSHRVNSYQALCTREKSYVKHVHWSVGNGNKKWGGTFHIQQQKNGYLNHITGIHLHFMQALKMTAIKLCNNIDISVTKCLVHKRENNCLLKILQPSKIYICTDKNGRNQIFC